ncbi:MAG: HD domain-containing protein [Clostridiaceae bacterium]|nr:HD domain-containing protein [Clostridiaceae bacterium]
MKLDEIKAIAFDNMACKRSHAWKERGNKYYHGLRVAKLAITLRGMIFPDDTAHDDILTVAAWFHDIANGSDEHAVLGAAKTRTLLENLCTQAELDEICGIIAVHDDRASGCRSFPDTVKLHQDADYLDHFGTFDIWSGFLYAAPHNQTIEEQRDFMIERFQEFASYRNELNFDVAKAIYNEKVNFFRQFTERFAVESAGDIWHLDEIVEAYRQTAYETNKTPGHHSRGCLLEEERMKKKEFIL